MKTFTLRLDDRQAEYVETMARAEGIPQAAWIKRAIDTHIRTVARTPDFQRRLAVMSDAQETAVNHLRNMA